MTSPTTSVIIRCFNEERHIGRLLSGLLNQTQRPDQIILVDSGSSDATFEIASRFPVEVHTIDPKEFSFGRSLNTGCQAANGEILADRECACLSGLRLVAGGAGGPLSDPSVALAYGRQVGDERTKYSEHRVMAQWFGLQSEVRQDHAFCNNANAAVRRSEWEAHPYDEDLTGLEDVDWAKRALERGEVHSVRLRGAGGPCP